jgi:N-acetylglucosaminyldiphosphoundecaprenol N-acetyl-beta-D-mannosaminyltransferase
MEHQAHTSHEMLSRAQDQGLRKSARPLIIPSLPPSPASIAKLNQTVPKQVPFEKKKFDFDRDMVCLFGLPYDRVTLEDAVTRTRSAIDSKERLHVATPNMNLVRLARTDPAVHSALLSADLIVADGMPLVWLAKFMRLGLPGRVPGSDLFDALHAQKDKPTPTFFFGGTDESAKRLLRSFPKNGSGIQAVGAVSPGFGSVDEMSKSSTLAAINTAAPAILVVSVSARKGLQWIARNERMVTAPVIANLGAVIHFATGTLKRAPAIWQHSGFEWLWRIRQEPELWSRYVADSRTLASLLLFHALPAVVMAPLLRLASSKKPQRVRIVMDPTHLRKVIHLEGSFTRTNLSSLREALATLSRVQEDVTLDLSRTLYLDAFALGLILVARGQLNRVGRNLSLTGVAWWMRTWLRFQGCSFLLSPLGKGSPVIKSATTGKRYHTSPIAHQQTSPSQFSRSQTLAAQQVREIPLVRR